MTRHQSLDSISAEWGATGCREDRILRLPVPLAQPGCDQRGRLPMHGSAPLLAALPHAPDMRARADGHVRAPQLDQLGHSEPGLDRQDQEHAIPSADPCRRVGRRHQGIDLFATQEGNRSSLVALGRDRQNATTAIDVGRFTDRHVPKEGVDSGEPDIARTSAVSTSVLDMVQKRADKRCVEIFQRQARWIFTEPLLGKSQEQSKRIAVRGDGVGTGLALSDESVGEEGLQQAGEGRARDHGTTSFRPSTSRSVARAKSSGTASRYQYVSHTWTCPR